MTITTILDTRGIDTWGRAKKIKGLRAKPWASIISDFTVATKFLLDTLEGKEPLDTATLFCIGETGDAWQQKPSALLKKYDIVLIDNEGWMHCVPKPENEVMVVQLGVDDDSQHYIRGLWGETIDGEANLQAFADGDYLLTREDDRSDVWIVRKALFEASYTML